MDKDNLRRISYTTGQIPGLSIVITIYLSSSSFAVLYSLLILMFNLFIHLNVDITWISR